MHVEYNLPFTPKDKAPIANKSSKCLNLFHPLQIFVKSLSIFIDKEEEKSVIISYIVGSFNFY